VLALKKPDDAALNMTPMIDIVFQLILFFLFNLRFKSVDWRIEANFPRDRGGIVSDPVPPLETLRVTLARLDADHPDRARTRVRLGGHEWTVPAPALGAGARDRLRDDLARAIERLRPYATDRGEIDVPPPLGAAVPHGDAILVLDAFLEAGVVDVLFMGTAPPLRSR
jgi:hypothetical protein